MFTENEIQFLISELHERFGYDFSSYSPTSFQRRVNRLLLLDKLNGVQGLHYRLMTDPTYITRFVEELTVNVTEMFRDPWFYKTLREHVIPQLAQLPFIRIWHAGCSTGEEVYSMAIVLKEAGLLERSLLYATDINADVVDSAAKGIFPTSFMQKYSENYVNSGGPQDFSSYYTASYDRVLFQEDLRSRMIFSTHNLVSDSSFNEFHLIMCRNVLIYFERNLQHRVLNLFDDSLSEGSYLCLGSKETLKFSNLKPNYIQLEKEKIWRKS